MKINKLSKLGNTPFWTHFIVYPVILAIGLFVVKPVVVSHNKSV